MTTPSYGTAIFRGQSGKDYSYSIYISDLGAVPVKWSGSGTAGASSESSIVLPENCQLIDICTGAAPTVSLGLQVLVNDAPNGCIILTANTQAALPTRGIPRMGFLAGRKFALMQV